MEAIEPKIRILLANSYNFEKVYQNWRNKINPSHYLMGKIELERSNEFVVDILPHEKYKWLNILGNFLKIPLLDQQVRVLLSMVRYDVLYFPYPLSNTKLIIFLKYIGVIRKPIVILAHQSFDKISQNKLSLRGYRKIDYIAFFSKILMKKSIKYLSADPLVANQRYFPVSWGPDRVFYESFLQKGVSSVESNFAVCAGTIDRDFDMLIDAHSGLPWNLKIFCTPTNYPNENPLPDNVTVDNSWIAYSDLLKEYSEAKFLIIPIKDSVKNKGNTFGLTVLIDAIAMGKPVLMTYHPYIDLDIEAENIGMWVRDNTVEGWKIKLKEMFEMKDQYEVMSKNASSLYKTKFNAEIFASEMAEIFRKAANR